jgi:hypothetical protein
MSQPITLGVFREETVGDKTQRGHDRKPTYAEIARRTPTRQAT